MLRRDILRQHWAVHQSSFAIMHSRHGQIKDQNTTNEWTYVNESILTDETVKLAFSVVFI